MVRLPSDLRPERPRLDAVEVAALVSIVRAATELEGRIERVGSSTVQLVPQIASPFFNRVLGLGVTGPVQTDELDAIATVFERADVKQYLVAVAPFACPPSLGDDLVARGFALKGATSKLWCRTGSTLHSRSDLRVARVAERDRELFARTASLAYGVGRDHKPWFAAVVGGKGWTHYLAYDGAQPVAAAALYVCGAYAWLGYAATIPAHRGRGAQSQLIAQRLADAAEEGAAFAVTETTAGSVSVRNLTRLGFTTAWERLNYLHG